jgi:hypothetical protein
VSVELEISERALFSSQSSHRWVTVTTTTASAPPSLLLLLLPLRCSRALIKACRDHDK